jgi:methyl-accepting chemotaxis protein
MANILNKISKRFSRAKTRALQDQVAESHAIKQDIDNARCVMEYTPAGIVTAVNHNWLQSLGYRAEDVIGQRHARFHEPGSNDDVLWQKLALGQNDTGEYKFVSREGEVRWYQGYYSPIPNANGTVVKVTSYMTDITRSKLDAASHESQIAAIGKSQAVIEFTIDGRIITANDNFLKVVGYSLNEVIGQHHSLFVDAELRGSAEYRAFWQKLGRGEYDAGQYKRVAKGDRKIWLQASYNPIFDLTGKPFKVIKYASDISHQKEMETMIQGQIEAIGQSLGIIAFSPDGRVIEINKNFLDTMGYTEAEALGQHHSAFVDAAYKASAEYRAFWEKLNRGEADRGVYKRYGKGGKEVWIQASYNPIKDVNGKVAKVVKFAIDVTVEKTRAVDFEGQLAAIGKNQAVIEFTPEGKVLAANENFLQVTGYSESEVLGQHHSLFVDAAYKASADYRAFWEKLGRGEYDAGQYKRVAKGGREVWLQASYNPILDMNGKVAKVVKFASEVTAAVQAQQGLVKAVAETQAVVAAAKAGDLMQRIGLDGKTGDIAELCGGVNTLIANMAEIIAQIKAAGDTINTAANEISAGNNDLSQRTEEQASSLEETASSMEELASTVKQNAENAKQANQLAAAASGVAIKGGSVVKDVVTTMSGISESSRKIEDIISVIDGIAFQTNILALNAAVEAARAGEQGRGFAVVAGEVRNLAQRSAAAAKEIKQLISDSVDKVQDGTKLVEEAGHTMEEIVTSVKRVTDIMGEIAAASSEQSSGIDQVNTAVAQMDEVTQQNAALVEQAAAAAESLVEQANTLMERVSAFKVESATTAKAPRPAAAVVKPQPASKVPPVSKASPPRVAKSPLPMAARTGTDDGDWEEF